jgi:hypothetical protein
MISWTISPLRQLGSKVDWGSVVGIATSYWLDSPEIGSQWGGSDFLY